MSSRSKLSSICWNNYIKGQIASSNFEGRSTVYMELKEHERRVLSVDFSWSNPTLFLDKTVSYVKFLDSLTPVSSSTDNTLKLWDLSDSTSQVIDCPVQLFKGRMNVKVGLSVSDGYIATSSEI
ncbi:putative transcription factor WD40-like family [Helianthus anomalus]